MRLAAAACALVIVACIAVVGVILSAKVSVSVSAPAPAVATSSAKAPVVAVRTVTDVAAERASLASTPVVDTPAVNAPAATPRSTPAIAETAAAPVPATTGQAPISAPNEAASPGIVLAQTTGTIPPPVAAATSCPGNPNALGIARTVEIDTTGGPGFGFEHFKSHDFLREGEVVLTFDDGPWPKNTQMVLAALAAHCTKAIFFPIGLHATYEPALLKQVAAAGHSIGSHTWSHQILANTKGRFKIGNGKTEVREFDPKDEIEKGISAVHWAVGGPTAPFFRFPGLKHPPELVTYLGQRNIGIFSTDFDSFDFKMRKPEQVRQSVLAKLKKFGKGMALMHDFQHATADATAALLNDLKAGGYKIVFMRPKFAVTTLPAYDEMVIKEMKLPTVDSRPTSSVVRPVD
jgi:peptidoglycan/xylan/chitin deacetylase (PgdA/CDA1 family)